MKRQTMVHSHLGNCIAKSGTLMLKSGRCHSRKKFKTRLARRTAKFVFAFSMLWPMAQMPTVRASTVAVAAAINAADNIPSPQDVIQRENDKVWQSVVKEVQANLPTPAPAPGTFSDLVPRRQIACAPQQIVTVGDKNIPGGLRETIAQAADETDTDAVYLMALADKESSFRKDAKASTSSARGLFQFLDATWLELIREFGARHGLATEADAITSRAGSLVITNRTLAKRIMDLRENPYVSAIMAAEMSKRDQARVQQNVGRSLERSEFYFTHFLGAGSAMRLIRAKDMKPATSATGLFPQAARANRSLFTSRAGRKRRGVTVAEFHQRIENMMEQRLDRYEEVERTVVAQAQLPR